MNASCNSPSSGSSGPNSAAPPSRQQQAEQCDAGAELCFVCNDASTGYHYGTPSCNGCKTFFRRTIMKKQQFTCQYDGRCLVDKSVRCACRHCRFEKCLAVGMSREAIQQNRDPIGYTKRTRRYPPAPRGASDGASSSSSSRGGGGYSQLPAHREESLPTAPADQPPSAERLAEDALLGSLMAVEQHIQTVRNSQIQLEMSLVDLVLKPSVFLDAEFLRKQAQSPAHTTAVLRRAKHPDYQYWHERDWLIMIEWAKTIGVFQRLPLNDRLALLRHSAITHPSLIQSFYTPNFGPDTISFPDGAFFDKTHEPDRPAGFQRKKLKMIDNLLAPMRRMDIDITEFAAIKGIFFLSPDVDDLSVEVKAAVSDGRAGLINALYRYIVSKRGREQAVDRFGKLLLLGTVIATMAVEAREAVVVAEFFEQVPFSSFAKQLLFGKLNAD